MPDNSRVPKRNMASLITGMFQSEAMSARVHKQQKAAENLVGKPMNRKERKRNNVKPKKMAPAKRLMIHQTLKNMDKFNPDMHDDIIEAIEESKPKK